VTQEDWGGLCRHTETVEMQYWKRDGMIPRVIDHTVINLNPGSGSGSDCENSDTDIEYSTIGPDEDTDTELAQPLQSK
jgi:hypothetical protein